MDPWWIFSYFETFHLILLLLSSSLLLLLFNQLLFFPTINDATQVFQVIIIYYHQGFCSSFSPIHRYVQINGFENCVVARLQDLFDGTNNPSHLWHFFFLLMLKNWFIEVYWYFVLAFSCLLLGFSEWLQVLCECESQCGNDDGRSKPSHTYYSI